MFIQALIHRKKWNGEISKECLISQLFTSVKLNLKLPPSQYLPLHQSYLDSEDSRHSFHFRFEKNCSSKLAMLLSKGFFSPFSVSCNSRHGPYIICRCVQIMTKIF